MMQYSFDEATHTHALDGNPVPGVTSILDACGLVSEFCKDEVAAERGRNGHKLAELVYTGKVSEYDIPPVSQPWVAAIERFVGDLKIRPYLFSVDPNNRPFVELSVWSKLGYAGIPDLLTEDLTLYDNKFWSSISKRSLANAGLQTAGYAAAIKERYGIAVRKRKVVVFNIDKSHPYEVRDLNDPADLPNFISCLNVFKLRQKYDNLTLSDLSAED